MRGDSTWSQFVSTHGESLALHDWPLSAGGTARGVVLLVHGLGEHVGRYQHVADRLNQWGFSVRGYDQYGHGESAGVRGDLPADDRLLTDLASIIDDTRARMDDRLPLILLG
ncbi:MAG TPA: alpha/beta hydrolase, partial [Ottowia sp.]|nr:alpha/beta hydrolase [Ottowia sp.]